MVSASTLLGGLLFNTAAFAAGPPEAPVTSTPAKSITATTAILEGTLNPGASATAGWYFAYSTEISCALGLRTPLEAEVTGKAVKEHIEVTGLEPSRKYTFCMVATSEEGAAATPGNEVTFETKPAPPAIESIAHSPVPPSEANPKPQPASEVRLEGVLNPNNQLSECHFQYVDEAEFLGSGFTAAGTATVPCTPELLKGFGGQGVGVDVAGLSPKTVYHYRIVAKNGKGEEATLEATFKTAITLETPETEKATGVTTTTATLHGVLNPAGEREAEPGNARFVYRQSATECQGAGEKTVAASPSPIMGKDREEVFAEAPELAPGTPYTFCLLAENGSEANETARGPPQTFTTQPVAPKLEEQSASGFGSTSATLNAKINPEGAATTYHFEYDTTPYAEGEAAHGVRVPAHEAEDPTIPTGNTPVLISQKIENLKENQQYHWRLVATNAAGTTTGPDHVFNYTTGAEGLPDGRAYEMVTPPFKDGALIGDTFGGFTPDISADGSHVGALSIQCFEPTESCNADRRTSGELYDFTRSEDAGQCAPQAPPCWRTSSPAPPASAYSEHTPWLNSSNEGDALFSAPTGPKGEDEWYASSSGGSFVPIGPATPPGVTEIYLSLTEPSDSQRSTADLSNLVWTEEDSRWPFDETLGYAGGPHSLYEYAGAHNTEPFLVGVTGETDKHELISTCGTNLGGGAGAPSTWNALSVDGRTVYFTANPDGEPGCFGEGETNKNIEVPVSELYARVDGETPEAHTVAISQPDAPQIAAEGARGHESPPDKNCTEETECVKNTSLAVEESALAKGEPGPWSDAEFEKASEDGSRVFFLDTQQLTNGAVQGSGSALSGGCPGSDCNLYLYDSGEPAGHNLVDVSAGSSAPEVQGVAAVSADGSHVYFVAKGRLATNESVLGRQAVVGEDNLYVYQRDASYPEGHTAFIAALSPSDYQSVWRPVHHGANVTPDGRFLVFLSLADLTPGDTRNQEYAQVFRYDAETEELVRVSIGNDGYNDNGNAGIGEATIVPANTLAELRAGPPRGDPTMSDDGSYVFFQSPIALTPHALDDVVVGHETEPFKPAYAKNVYEYHEGHVYLISDGRDAVQTDTPCKNRVEGPAHASEFFGSAVCLLGADATGHNVFFMTGDPLVPKDTDTQVDIYDARVCEPEAGNPCITEPSPPLPPCLGEQCHGIPPERSPLLTGGSETLNGKGNLVSALPPPAVKPKALTRAQKLAAALKVCKRDKKKSKRKSCEAAAKKKYGVAKKSSKKKGK